jgi:CubicO group peptidase (beta-lactamase class C family)
MTVSPAPDAAPGASFDAARLRDAVALAERSETNWPRELDKGINSDTRAHEPKWNEVIGPTQARGDPNGTIWHGGKRVASWGDPNRVDMTFSVTKSFLSLLAGIAVQDGLIKDLDARIGETVHDGGFDSDQNAPITWRHMLEQTSEWQGTLFGKPDQVDHFRNLNNEGNSRKGELRTLAAPGTYWEYNDVRVNRFSLCLLNLFERPLPDVLRERIMDPIGATGQWQWHPYRNAQVTVAGQAMMSVPGGGHWGGGLFISSEDLVRVGRFVQLDGQHDGKALLPSGWTTALRKPSKLNSTYGLMWWLNTDGAYVTQAPHSSYFMIGAGSNVVWIDDELDLVVVLRWINRKKLGEIVESIINAMH